MLVEEIKTPETFCYVVDGSVDDGNVDGNV